RPGRGAGVTAADGALVGHAGELAPRVVAELGLPPRAVALEIDLGLLLDAAPDRPRQVRGLSTFPLAKEDIALVVPADVPAGEVLDVVTAAAGEVAEEVRLFDVYTGANLPEGTKSLAFALRLRGDRTRTGEDTAAGWGAPRPAWTAGHPGSGPSRSRGWSHDHGCSRSSRRDATIRRRARPVPRPRPARCDGARRRPALVAADARARRRGRRARA